MVKPTSNTVIPQCLRGKNFTLENLALYKDYGPRYEWDEERQAKILGSFFYGFVLTSAPGGYVSECIGPFWTIFIFTLITALLNSLCVWATYIDWKALFVVRFLMGLACYGPRYTWEEQKQGRILGSYYYGYVISSAPGGYVSECIGPFWTLFIFSLVAGVFNSACVWAAHIHWILLFVCRFIIGFAAGFIYPALQGLIAQWAPPQEKGKFVAALMGNTLGTCLTWILVGQVTDKAGWAWGFHFLTIQIIVYLVVLWFLVSDTPETHKWISEEEKNYIKESQGAAVSKIHKTKAAPPYLKIFTSLPFWALQVCHIGNLYGLYLQLNGIPKFMAEVVGFNIKDSGWTSAVPQLVRLFLGTGFGMLGDFVKKKQVPPAIIRRAFVLCSHIIPGILVATMGLVKCNAVAGITLLTISLGLNGAVVMTNLQNPQDLAPNFAATLFGIMSTIGGCTGFLSAEITSQFIKESNSIKQWGYNFLLGGSIYVFCGVFFIIFCSTKTQPWNERREEQTAAA